MKNAIQRVPVTAQAASQKIPEFPVRPNGQLTDLQLAAIRLLVLGKSATTTAQAVGVDRRTVYTWRQSDVFRRELSRLRRRLWGEAADRLRALVHPSLDIFEQHLRKRHERTRFRAANAVLRHANLRKCVPLPDSLDDCEDDEPDYD